jgi:hypothetical protein
MKFSYLIPILLIYTLFISSQKVLASYAKVLMLKGVAEVSPDGNEYHPLNSKSIIAEGSSVRTGAKSVLKLKITGKGVVVLGPLGQMKIESLDERKPSFIKLAKGQFRAILNKEKKEDYKLIVKTKTAALGVRGTDFLIVHNDVNDITSTVAYEGQVAMRKVNHSKEFDSAHLADRSRMFFDDGDTAIVPPGRFAGTYKGQRHPSSPTKISPIQLKHLKNSEYVNKTNRVKVLTSVDEKLTDEEAGLYSRNEGRGHPNSTRPRSGGYLDLDTSIYVPPPNDAEFNNELGIYVPPKDYGGVNSETGDYIPPWGLVLHPLKGFLVIGQKIKEGIVYSGEKIFEGATFLGKRVVKGAQMVGSGVAYTGEVIYEGTSYLGGKVLDSASFVGEKILETGAFTGRKLASLATSMNNQIYNHFLEDIHKVIKGNKYLSKMQIKANISHLYSNNITDNFYHEIETVTHIPSNSTAVLADIDYKRYLFDGWYFTPKGKFDMFHNHRNIKTAPSVRALNSTKFKYGFDGGFENSFLTWFPPSQTFIEIRGGHEFREDIHHKQRVTYNREFNYGITESMRVNKWYLLKGKFFQIDYQRRYGIKGNIMGLKISQYVYLGPKHYLGINTKLTTHKSNKSWKAKLEYGKKGLSRNINMQLTASHIWANLRNIPERGMEKEIEGVLVFTYLLPTGLSINTGYQYNRNCGSNTKDFNFDKHQIGAGVNFSY